MLVCLQANCCSDHVHCCPPEFKCDILKQECVGKRGLRIRWINTIPPHKSSTSIRKGLPSHMDIKCLDGHSECKSGQTCCKLASGDYGCCPIPKVWSIKVSVLFCVMHFVFFHNNLVVLWSPLVLHYITLFVCGLPWFFIISLYLFLC